VERRKEREKRGRGRKEMGRVGGRESSRGEKRRIGREALPKQNFTATPLLPGHSPSLFKCDIV